MTVSSWILSEPYAGLQSQALGLAEAAGLSPQIVPLRPRSWWPWDQAAISLMMPSLSVLPGIGAAHWPTKMSPGLVFSIGGAGAAAGAVLHRDGHKVVQIQNPRMSLRRFDLVIANTHDELTGSNVIVTRTALHRVTPLRLAEARAIWAPRLAHLSRPLVTVLVGGSNGRLRLGDAEGSRLARALGEMMVRSGVGLAVTPSRRTPASVRDVLARELLPLGAWLWDMTGDNPYFGLIACADVIVVTADSVSMVSEAVATPCPVLLAELPGHSRRIDLFHRGLLSIGRIRHFQGHYDVWPVEPIDDTAAAAAEMRHRLGF